MSVANEPNTVWFTKIPFTTAPEALISERFRTEELPPVMVTKAATDAEGMITDEALLCPSSRMFPGSVTVCDRRQVEFAGTIKRAPPPPDDAVI